MTPLPLTKPCELEDFADSDLIEIMRDVCVHKHEVFGHDYPKGFEYRKDWEVAMAIRAFRREGSLRPDAKILGVGAGYEDTLFWLTRHCDQVFATDRYADAQEWQGEAPLTMLVEPSILAPYSFDEARLVCQHMDGRLLRYPSDTFDGVFSSGSIEHFGSVRDIAFAAYEMGRVVKPGGIVSISTELRFAGPPGGTGFEGVRLFSRTELQRYIVEASGLELIGRLTDDISPATAESERRDLATVVRERNERVKTQPFDRLWMHLEFPHLLLSHEGYVFGSVHLALRKGDGYPYCDNSWAKPTSTLAETIRSENAVSVEKSRAIGRPRASRVGRLLARLRPS